MRGVWVAVNYEMIGTEGNGKWVVVNNPYDQCGVIKQTNKLFVVGY